MIVTVRCGLSGLLAVIDAGFGFNSHWHTVTTELTEQVVSYRFPFFSVPKPIY